MSTSDNDVPLNFLSFDGGGVRGVSELVILDRIMRRLQEKEGLESLPRPCDYFDLMAGTSTGGLIAILLGRLQMTTAEALATYDEVAKRIFGMSNRKAKLGSQFKASTLRDAVEKIVAQHNKGDLLIDPNATNRKGKAFVCAVETNNLDAVQRFRTYETGDDTNEWLNGCKIWEAARATTAAPIYFKDIKIEGGSVAKSFVDAAVGYNNPTDELLEEAGRVFNKRRKIGVILSLGTGTRSKTLPSLADVGHRIYLSKLGKTMKDTTVDTERVHLGLKNRFKNFPNSYIRFNVPGGAESVGLAEWDKMTKLKNLTADYMKQQAVDQEIEAVVDILSGKKTTGITVGHVSCLGHDDLYIDSRVARSMGSASEKFVGRRDVLERLDVFFSPRSANSTSRRQFLLCGMGGAGKTQIALKFAENARQRFKYIFWVDAENLQTARQSFRDIAIADMGQEMKSNPSMEDVQNWISSLREEWLLLLDNSNAADLERITPVGNRGNIIYTSRDKHLGLALPEEAVAVVNDLEIEDAVTLLLRAANMVAYSVLRRKEAQPIAIELGCLALAIDQAGSYIFMERCTLSQYLDHFRKRREEMLRNDRYKGADPRSQAVYTTFDISYQAIRALAKDQEGHLDGEDARSALKILDLVCFYHNEGIPEEMFERAATFRHRKVSRGQYDFLEDFKSPLDRLFQVDSDMNWNSMPFRFGAMLLEQFSLIKQDRRRESISMHVLVHSWARDRMEPKYFEDRLLCAKVILCCAVPISTKQGWYDCYFRRKLYPHAKALEQYVGVVECCDEILQSSLDLQLGYLAQEGGDYLAAEQAYQRALDFRKWKFGLDSRETLEVLPELASLYERQARLGEAENIRLEVLERSEYTFGRDSTESEFALLDLCNTYLLQSRLDAMEKTQLQTLQLRMRRLKIDDPKHEKLKSINKTLEATRAAMAMADNCEHARIEDLETKLDMCLRKYDKWDPRTLAARLELGEALESEGRFTEAELQLEKWANGHANIYGPEDPRFLKATRRFAMLRVEQGHTPEAETLFREVLEKCQRLRGPGDIEAYYTLSALGLAIVLQGRFDEGVLLMEKSRDLQESVLGADHLFVKGAYEAVAKAIQMASTATPEKRRFMARRAMQTIGPNGPLDEKDLDAWTTIKHYALIPGGWSRPEMAYLTEEDINQGTRFPNVLDSAAEMRRERLIELIKEADCQQGGLNELINAAHSQQRVASDDFV